MSGSLRKRRRRQSPSRPASPGQLRLWPIGAALVVCFLVAAFGLAGLIWIALSILHHPRLPRSATVSLHDFVGVLQLVFASVAGAGALVALVVAYRRQRVAEASSAYDRTRVLNERFTTIAAQLGDSHAAVRLAGVHAMAGLADDWEENRQTCVDVLCAFLRMPYEADPGEEADTDKRLDYLASREVRHTVIRVITAHLRPDATVSWQGLILDFTGVVFDGGDFTKAVFSGGTVLFTRARFTAGALVFDHAVFRGGCINFYRAEFCGGVVSFDEVTLCDTGEILFDEATFSGGELTFDGATFSGGRASFLKAGFLAGGKVTFLDAALSGGRIGFEKAQFSGALVSFARAEFAGATVDFSEIADWSHPPQFNFEGSPPVSVLLPEKNLP